MNLTKSFHKTRIAPTPSGFLHLGNAFSFILTTVLARKTGASILLRIDDMDQARAQDEYIRDIFDLLEFLELPWDEGPRNLKEFRKNSRSTPVVHLPGNAGSNLYRRERSSPVIAHVHNCSSPRLTATIPAPA
ncbi:hypothetical protein FSB84_30565 [Pseudobacter ginsenosidimutans]|uniref:glutamate--tRNA ligase family protein n=1 Tax=Pseudobacter ginsenosidimutans TaxID=661488 RepID=UPI0011BBD3B7|nr:glutamate--tRNA ligase family protein [Pseudobacter ginsenosidimutans]QEC45818.1 hypothetical protein FSB84_30565 [Pseudobacter ginsenosidimutans]